MYPDDIFREYDIRGIVGADIDEYFAYRLAKAFASIIFSEHKQKIRICFGYDGRSSSSIFAAYVIAALNDMDVEIINLGMVTTPMLYYADLKFQANASIMITGSHNSGRYNGFKLVKDNKPFSGKLLQNLKLEIKKSLDTKIPEIPEENPEHYIDIYLDYIHRLLEDVKISPTLKVVWDCAGGVISRLMSILEHRLPNKNIILNKFIDGNFVNHSPDPTKAENLQALIAAVKRNQYDLGIAFDGDGDRLVVVNSRGNIIKNDSLLLIFARSILKNLPGSNVITDIKFSYILSDYIKALGGNPITSKTGHSNIKEAIKKHNAVLAGELSGHIFFADKYYGFDDGIYAALRLIDILAENKFSLEELYDMLPKVYFNSGEIRVNVENKFQIVENIKTKLLAAGKFFDDLDGIKVVYKSSWWLVRPSNTEEVLSIIFEANSAQELNLLKAEIHELFGEYNLNL